MKIIMLLLLVTLMSSAHAQGTDPDGYGRERLTTLARTNWPRVITALAEADKAVKSKKLAEARRYYRAARGSAEVVRDSFRELLQQAPHLGTFGVPVTADGKTVSPARDLLEAATKAIQLCMDKDAELAAGANREVDAKVASAVAALRGDRKRAYQEYKRLPTAWDGSTYNAVDRKLASLVTSAYWVYGTNTCTLTYRFAKDKLVRIDREPLGCRY
jgi:hypothetical protein